MDSPYTPAVQKISQEQSFVDGHAVDVVRVEYLVGKHGPFVERIAKGDFNAEKLQALMQATALVLQQLGATS